MHGIPVKVCLLSLFSGQHARYTGDEEVGAGFRCAACGCLRYPWGGGVKASQLTEPEGSWLFCFLPLM